MMDATSSTPSIRVSQHIRYPSPDVERHSPSCPSRSPASPMSIPNASRDHPVPPALPPPQHPDIDDDVSIGHHKGWDWFNKDYVNQHWTDFGRAAAVKPGSSLLGGKRAASAAEGEENAKTSDNEIDPARRGSSISTITPAYAASEQMHEAAVSSDKEDGASKPQNYRLQGERPLEQRSLDNSSQAYDRNLLARIGGPKTPNRLSISFQSPTGSDNMAVSPSAENRPEHGRHLSTSSTSDRHLSTSSASDRHLSTSSASDRHLSTSSASDRRHPSFDGAYRWPMAAPGTASPGSFRNPGFDPENSRLPTHRHSSFPFDDNASHRSSYDQAMFMSEGFPMEEGQMKDLNINDRSPSLSDEYQLAAKAGMKRRASSPHREAAREERSSVSSAPGSNDLYTRRSMQQVPSRNSPVPKYVPNHGSVSSASSYGPRNGSMASSYGLSVASSATSITSGRLSPGTLSPAIDPELGNMSYTSNKPRNTSPGPQSNTIAQHVPTHETISTLPAQYPLDGSQPRQDGTLNSTSSVIPSAIPSGVPNAQGMLMCECCPKKPKKFNTQDELRAHLMEKQYTCAYCPNRFKNKNEAERHQNSLHLRRHSWSCAALHSVENVFHASTSNQGATDVCGFCGIDFANPADWAKRRDHVCHEHKFGECNQAKKFFRADHFRQHLKHSHGGLSGKWTNMLESVCMRDEPPPQTMADRASQMMAAAAGVATQSSLPSNTTGLMPGNHGLGVQGMKPEVIIEEVPHHDS